MRRLLTLALAATACPAFADPSAPFGLSGGKATSFSCRFAGLERVFTKNPHIGISLTTSEKDGKRHVSATLRADPEEPAVGIAGTVSDDTAALDSTRRSLLQNYRQRDKGDSYHSKGMKDVYMVIEAPLYEGLGQATRLETIRFSTEAQDQMEAAHLFYDKDLNLLATYVYSRFSSIHNFCIQVHEAPSTGN